MDFYGVTQEKVVAGERDRIEDVAIEGADQTPIQRLSLTGLFFGCVGMFGAEILGDAGQTKWLTWNYDAAPVNYCVHVSQSNITQIFRNVKFARE